MTRYFYFVSFAKMHGEKLDIGNAEVEYEGLVTRWDDVVRLEAIVESMFRTNDVKILTYQLLRTEEG